MVRLMYPLLVFMLFITDGQVEYVNCTNGEMRLSGGSSSMNGRTEICYNNLWFGICAESFNYLHELNLICEILGFSNRGSRF